MSHPDLLARHLDDEDVVATVNLSGEDALVITPTRSLLYESEGILSDESVSAYPHEVDAVGVSRGRRKATIELSYPIEGEKRLRVGKERLDTVLHYILAGIFHARGITRSGETVRSVFQFNELTVVVTSDRVLSHVGTMVWDQEYDEYRYSDLTGLEYQEGNIATEIVLYVEGRSRRIKVPNARAEEVKRSIEDAVFEFFEVDSLDAFREAVAVDGTPDPPTDTTGISFDDAVQPLGADPSDDPEVTTQAGDGDPFTGWPYEAGLEDEDSEIDLVEIEETLEYLASRIEEQRRILDEQKDALEDLADWLPED